MEGKIKIGISSCLLGEQVRFDGGHKLDRFLKDTLGKYVEWIPVCPEVEYGLSIPRESMRLVGNPDSPRLITNKTKTDHTDGMKAWAEKKLRELAQKDLCGFVFKSKSPSSGWNSAKVYSASGVPARKGSGIFAAAFTSAFPILPVEDDGRLHDPMLRENFIERLFVFSRWKAFTRSGGDMRGLVSFHTEHKLLLMAHSQKHYRMLGHLVANNGKKKKEELHSTYIQSLMEGLRLIATVKKNTNVLMHLMGYFKKKLEKGEKAELLGIIENYHEGLIPLIVPVTLINHYVRKYDEPYLKEQYYLNPHPLELMLRNHV